MALKPTSFLKKIAERLLFSADINATSRNVSGKFENLLDSKVVRIDNCYPVNYLKTRTNISRKIGLGLRLGILLKKVK